MIELCLKALLFGAWAGFSPGPFTTLIISESLTHGRRAGLRCCLAPLITDPPIIALCFLVLLQLKESSGVIAVISLLGSVVLLWIALKCLKVNEEMFNKPSGVPKSLGKAIGVNFLNPNPYIFWSIIVGPTLISAAQESIVRAGVFVLVFYLMMFPIKMSFAIVAGGARHRLNTKWLVIINRILGVVMLFYAFSYAWGGIVKMTSTQP